MSESSVESKSVRHLFIDLEDTIITPVMDGWFNTHLINLPALRKAIEHYQPTAISIFSFAVWNEQERLRFNMGCRPMIEAALGVTLGSVLTVDDDMIPMCCRQMGMSPQNVDFQEMSNFWGKAGAFKHCMREIYKYRLLDPKGECSVALIDDVVFDEDFWWRDYRLQGFICNVDKL